MNARNSYLLLAAALLAACSSKNRDDPPPPPAMNQAPAVSAIANVAANQDTVVNVDVGIIDDQTPANQLTVSVAADGGSPFPADGLAVTGAGPTRTIMLTPLEAVTGTANVTLTVTDAAGLATARSFSVTVNARAASVRDTTLSTFAKGETEAATPVNGFTYAQDADDPAAFAALIPPGDD